MCVQSGASVHTQMCVCRYFCKDVGVGHMPTSLCVPASLCEVSLDTGTVAGSSVWILPQERWGPALASALMCGCSWALFLCPLAHEGSSPLRCPCAAWAHGAQAWDNDRQVVEQGQWQAGAAKGAVPAPPTSGADSSLVPFLPASLILSCPGAEAFCISQKPDSPQR